MSRTKSSQLKHDSAVRREANELKKQGWGVKADVRGFSQPETINGVRPDIIAKKGEKTKIIEFETPDSKNTDRDKEQQEKFRKEANKSKDTTFTRKIAKQNITECW